MKLCSCGRLVVAKFDIGYVEGSEPLAAHVYVISF